MMDESERINERDSQTKAWEKWGPYLSERQWGTVREDYSADGNAWEFTSHDNAKSCAYRWGEEGIGGISDKNQYLCFSLALWNGNDPILKERLFGLTSTQGNHGEDVKELYYYLDNIPSHSYMKMLYKYPITQFPYEELITENANKSKQDSEFELIDTGIFDHNNYFDVTIEYGKITPEDILINITIHNCSQCEAQLSVIPQLWFRNTWAWGINKYHPQMWAVDKNTIQINDRRLANQPYFLYAKNSESELLFCDNESNHQKLYGTENPVGYFKDGINNAIVHLQSNAINSKQKGTKVGIHNQILLKSGAIQVLQLRLSNTETHDSFNQFDNELERCKKLADDFYEDLQQDIKGDDLKNIQRQAYAGMLWSKQYYYIDIPQWISGDPGQPPPPHERKTGRNAEWIHLNNADILSMPDKWEYPWYAAWDLAFHCIPLAKIDIEFAKQQLILLTREWYMHPNGQLPAYEWNFSDVNPPVHAWAAWEVYNIEKQHKKKGDRSFLEAIFHKLLINFTWWVNRKDLNNQNIFQGGFLGLDNIGVFDRSAPLPGGGRLEQADATSWMAMYSLNMMRIALELALENDVYENMATKFFEHFLLIAGAMNSVGEENIPLWDTHDEFFYDVLHIPEIGNEQLKIRSIVGLTPLFAIEVLDAQLINQLPQFKKRLKWFLKNRPELAKLVSHWEVEGIGKTHLLSLLRGHRMKCLIKKMVAESEFLSPYGIRSLSAYHHIHSYCYIGHGQHLCISYEPGESESNLFGGNSNWRGPIWFPTNYMLIKSLLQFYSFYGSEFKIEFPTGSGNKLSLREIALEIAKRLLSIFTQNEKGQRAVNGTNNPIFQSIDFKNHLLFYEYFHGENGKGLGASHQTGWTGLIAELIDLLK